MPGATKAKTLASTSAKTNLAVLLESRLEDSTWLFYITRRVLVRHIFRKDKEISLTSPVFQQCVSPACRATYDVDEVLVACSKCGSLLDVAYDWDRLRVPKSLKYFEEKWARRSDPHCFSGVWRFHNLLPFVPVEQCVTVGEGQTLLLPSEGAAEYTGVAAGRLYLQYEGINPSGSF